VSNRLSSNANRYASAQWYEITPDPTDPTKATGASHALTSPTVAFYFPALLAGCAGSVSTNANGVTSCSTSPFVGLEVSGSGPRQDASAFRVASGGNPTVYATGVSAYTLNSRWGDYPAAAADPTSAKNIWVLGEYAASRTAWGTAVTTITP